MTSLLLQLLQKPQRVSILTTTLQPWVQVFLLILQNRHKLRQNRRTYDYAGGLSEHLSDYSSSSAKSQLSFLSLNVCGLKSKHILKEFVEYISKHDHIGFQETKLTSIDEIHIENNEIFTKNRVSRTRTPSGGIALAVTIYQLLSMWLFWTLTQILFYGLNCKSKFLTVREISFVEWYTYRLSIQSLYHRIHLLKFKMS